MPETCNGAGFYLPIPREITPRYPRPVPREVVEPWLELMVKLESDADFYQEQSRRARESSAIYRPENLVPRYLNYFESVLNTGSEPGKRAG